MNHPSNAQDWGSVVAAPRSPFFGGGKEDTAFDRTRNATLSLSEEALFTQSNGRVLLGHAANGSLRFVALPTQVYPAPTGTGEFGLGVGMYHHFDVALYAGNLSYCLELEGRETPLRISSWDAPSDGLPCETAYGDDFLPLTTAQAEELEIALLSFAPVAPDAETAALTPAPLPGPAGAIYVLRLRNTGDAPIAGRVVLQAGDLLVGHYQDASLRNDPDPGVRAMKAPSVDLHQHTLILSRPFGAVGIHLHNGRWRKTTAPFEAESAFELAPGEEHAFETHIALGATYADVMPTLFALHLRPALDWINLTRAFWLERLGRLSVDADGASDEAGISRDIYVRSLFDNFNCLQTDAAGELLSHWQGAPSHGYGTVWGIDVEPTAVSIVHLCPEMTWATLRFFMNRSRAPKGPRDHSVPILVAPIIIARQWLQITGDIERLRADPEVMAALLSIVDDLMALKAPEEALFPSRFSSDGGVGRRYDYGTNVKVWYAFDSMAYLARALGDEAGAAGHSAMAAAIREAIHRTMVGEAPVGLGRLSPIITGGTNLGEEPGTFYLPEQTPDGDALIYYDGEDTSSMLAPVYGLCALTDPAWTNYHRWARSIWCPNFDPEFGGLRWSPRGFAGGALDGTGFVSRLGGSLTPQEMREALSATLDSATDDVTGSLFWWPYGREYRRSLTRCSQGQGAWAWQYLKQWLGLEVDAATATLTLAPRGLLTAVDWEGFRAGPYAFDIAWHEEESHAVARITNRNATPWRVQAGFRTPGTGAAGALAWQSLTLAPGVETTLTSRFALSGASQPAVTAMSEADMVALEVRAEGGADGILIKRFGPAHLWGHWDHTKLWNPQAMPLTIRLLIENGTDEDWEAIDVTLACPAGWHAQGRPPRQWLQPQAVATEAGLSLPAVPAFSRATAPFWVAAPTELALDLGWHESQQVPFHTTTQPEPGITLYAVGLDVPVEVAFRAAVRITTHAGDRIERQLDIPVRILPS